MKFPKNPNIPDNVALQDVVDRIAKLELTREAAAQGLGMTYAAFSSLLRRKGMLEKIKHTRLTAGPNNPNFDPDKAPAYEAAIQTALKHGNIAHAARLHGVNELVLGRKVRREKEAA